MNALARSGKTIFYSSHIMDVVEKVSDRILLLNDGQILAVFIVIAITALLYTVVLKFFNGEKLKDIINYFQIFLAFIVYNSYNN